LHSVSVIRQGIVNLKEESVNGRSKEERVKKRKKERNKGEGGLKWEKN